LDEAAFRWEHNTDPCAVDLLSNGIVRFANDAEKLDAMLKAKL
jgi:transaldolase